MLPVAALTKEQLQQALLYLLKVSSIFFWGFFYKAKVYLQMSAQLVPEIMLGHLRSISTCFIVENWPV
jgi:hypothetical protein